MRDIELQPLVPGAELICVALGALVPCLLGYSVIAVDGAASRCSRWLPMAVGVAATALSAALSWGPAHAWAWLSLPVQLGLLVGAGAGRGAAAGAPARLRRPGAAGAGACT